MSTVSHRTQHEVVEFIQAHSINGELRKSMMDIAEQMGLSNATIHRALKRLETDGIIRVIPAEKPTEPNTIIYQGLNRDIDNIESITSKTEQILTLAQSLAEDYSKLGSRLKILEKDAEQYRDLQSRIVSIQDVPGEFQMILVKKAASQ